MNLLLDTHIFLWFTEGSLQLKPSTRRLIDCAERVYVSAVTILEIAIKSRLGKLQAEPRGMIEAVHTCGFRGLPVSMAHAATVATLTLHHKDPFDRLLLAQAVSESFLLVTADDAMKRYGNLVVTG